MTDVLEPTHTWELFKSDAVPTGNVSEHYVPDLICFPCQERPKDNFCTGFTLLEEARKHEDIFLLGHGTSPDHFPDDWKQYTVVLLGSRFRSSNHSNPTLAVLVYRWNGKCWEKEFKHMNTNFSTFKAGNKNLRIAIVQPR